MKPNSITIGVISSATLIATAAVLYWIASSSGGENYREGITAVQKIQQLASNWIIETERVKSDPLADFDSLAAFIPQMDRLKEDLSNVLRAPDIPDRLAAEVSAYLSALDAKQERIERFKTGYAVIRNSVSYLPLAATEVVQQAQEANDAAAAQNITRLADEINAYLATPAEPEKRRLALALDNLRDASVAYPPPLTNATANFISHAQVLLDKQAPTEDIFQEATSDNISDLTEKLINSLEFELSKKRTVTAYSERGMLAAIAGLLLICVWLALQKTKGGALALQAATTPKVVTPQRAVAVRDQELVQPSSDLVVTTDDDKGSMFGVSTTAGSVMLHKMLAGMVADNLATSAHRISTSMDILNQIQGKIQTALEHSERAFDPDSGNKPEEVIRKLRTELQEINARSHLDAASTVVSSVHSQANNIADLAKRLTSFSKKHGGVEYGLVNVNDCIEEVVQATRVDTVVSVVREFGSLPEIFASKTEICLMLANVVENAALAIREQDRDKGLIKIETARDDGNIMITITDNGSGIPTEKRKKIFNLFYTSRDKGMGIGLASTNFLVRKYEGTISLNSLAGEGTAVRIALPADTSNA
ncbi:MAG: DAHL domain-containing protein [Gammaproteobacteria bacterium]